jgi:hypothetical protein
MVVPVTRVKGLSFHHVEIATGLSALSPAADVLPNLTSKRISQISSGKLKHL